VARIMRIARELGGVISGEHGIGITKLEFLARRRPPGFPRLQGAHRPGGTLQQGQAAAGRRSRPRLHAELQSARPRVADHAAVGHRLDLRRHQGLPALRQSASRCARRTCRGPICSTRRATRSSPPRLLIEAFLYEEQTRRGVSIQHWDAFSDVATTARSATSARRLPGGHRLRRRLDGHARPAAPHGQAAFQRGQGRLDAVPERDRPDTIKVTRRLMIDWGFKASDSATARSGCWARRRLSARPRPPAAGRRCASR